MIYEMTPETQQQQNAIKQQLIELLSNEGTVVHHVDYEDVDNDHGTVIIHLYQDMQVVVTDKDGNEVK